MTTIGGYALVICFFLVTPIVLVRHSAELDSSRVWRWGPPIFALAYLLAWTLGPPLFWFPLNGDFDLIGEMPTPWPPFLAISFWWLCFQFEELALSSQFVRFCFLLPDTVLFAVAITMAVSLAKRKDEREEAERKRKIAAAIDRITADGKVEGPKGPYVPHRRWNVGLGVATPHETKPDVHAGPYGNPVP